MKINKEPSSIWREYNKCIAYNQNLDLYNTVEKNENFYNDKQWEGLKAPDLDKPVFNFLKPVVNYYVATLVSDDISANIELAGNMAQDGLDIPRIIGREIDNIMEAANVRYKNRKIIRNCAVDGDACMYFYFDPDVETGYDYKGGIKAEIVNNTNVLFGNPCDEDKEEQPYILIVYRRLVSQVREEAEANGVNPESIIADDDTVYTENSGKDYDNEYCTVILKMWKENGTVWFLKTTKNTIIKEATDTGYKLYPISYMTWESTKECYHGVSPITGKIPNQIFVNKLYAMAMEYTKKMAFPKILYDKTKIPGGWNNNVSKAVGVIGNPQEAFFANWQTADMSSSVLGMIGSTIDQSKEMMGAYNSALGNVNPDNTSAIIATQKAAAAPLDIQRMDFYNFVESYVRIFIEMMRVNYGMRNVTVAGSEGQKQQVMFDFSEIGKYAYTLNIDIGQASYWSELMQISTLDNMMGAGIIPSAKIYLEALPDGYVKDKAKIIEGIEEMQAAQMSMGTDMVQNPAQEITQGAPPQEAPQSGIMPKEEMQSLAQELSQLSNEQRMQALDGMDISDEEKELIIELAEEIAGGNEDAM